MKTAILVDSTASLDSQLKARDDIFIAELSVIDHKERVYTDTTNEAEMDRFYQALKEAKELPTTSQAEPMRIVETYETLVSQGFERVFVLTISAVLSGTHQTIYMVSEEFKDQIKTIMIDTKGTSYKIEHMVYQLLELLKEGVPEEEIIDGMHWLAQEGTIHLVVDDLFNLVKGGRLSQTGAILGSGLRIKPILYFTQDGSVEVYKKVRTQKRVDQEFIQLVKDAVPKYPKGFDVAFAHGGVPEEAERMKNIIDQEVPGLDYRIGYLTPVLGVHGGYGTLGIGVLPRLVDFKKPDHVQ